MATMRWVFLGLLVGSALLHGQETMGRFSSAYDARLHFFGAPRVLPDTVVPSGSGLTDSQKKSVGLAAIYSLVLPGMGELYAHGFASGRYFLGAEVLLWLTYATFEVYGNSLRDDARAFAVAHAGVNPSGKNDQFYVDVGNFLNINAYNDKKLRDRQPEKLYDPNAGYAWQWETDAMRSTFRGQRIASENMYNNRKFVAAAIIINHVASAINAARAAIARNNELSEPLGDLRFNARVMGDWTNPHGIMLTVTKGF